MADKTRQETVEDNLDAVIEEYGPNNYYYIALQCLKDIDISLGIMVDTLGSGGDK